jgi:hypothetical protein
MTNPNHPAKVVIMIRGGIVEAIFTDKKVETRFFTANYDDGYIDGSPDHRGQMRTLTEDAAILDTAAVRNIINKKGAK